jgi:enamine deaminase RidA (YjgF/YER057c/UK114 family)
MKRTNISSGAKWEDIVGYSRAVRIGNIIEISGTAPVDGDKVFGIGDAYAQTKFCLQKIEKALIETGSSMNDVIRTRMFVTDISLWEDYGRAHREYFLKIKPVTSMVEVKSLIDPDMLIEIEATAIILNNEKQE